MYVIESALTESRVVSIGGMKQSGRGRFSVYSAWLCNNGVALIVWGERWEGKNKKWLQQFFPFLKNFFLFVGCWKFFFTFPLFYKEKKNLEF